MEVGGRVVSVAVALLAENLDAQHFYRTNFFRKCEKMQESQHFIFIRNLHPRACTRVVKEELPEGTILV